MQIKFNDLSRIHQPLKADFLAELSTIYDNNAFISGKKVESFEKSFASFCNTNYALGISNGYDSLKIALKSLDLPPNSEIIVPANTFIATWFAVSNAGFKVVPVEPDAKTYNIDISKIEQVITPNTKAIIPVHLYGQACEMDKIVAIAKKYNLFVIEDNAQAQGAIFGGKVTGSFGDINATSFYPGKNLGAAGDAGAIVTNNETLYLKAKMLRNYGSLQKYEHQIIGENSRMDEMQAVLLNLKIAKLTEWNTQRQVAAKLYNQYLKDISEIILPEIAENATSVYHLYVIRTTKRDELQQFLKEKGIETIIHYPIPPHLQKAYSHLGYSKGDFPITEEIAATCLSLPIFPGITEAEINYVSEAIKDFFTK